MNSHKLSALLDYCKTHLSQKRCRTILVALACVVVFGTTYALILPAVTMTTVCGLEEHEHTDDCYEEVLACGEEEGEDHQHDASCYERELVCGQEEHQHTEDCYAHDDEDDTEDADAQDPDAEEEPDEPEEEPEAPDWAEDLPDLTGNWAEDVAAIAQSQEGTDIARYGDWYTETYGADEEELDTTAPFVAFCLYYAEVDEDALPREANSEAWYETLEDAFGDETPAPGDLLFYEQEGTRMGIVTDVDVSDEDEYTYTVVESDLDGEVGESERLSDADILAYVPLPENPDENGGSTEEPNEPDRPSDNDQDRDTTGDNDRADDTDSDRDTPGGDKSDASGDNAGQKDEDPADEPAETPEEDPDTLPAVPKDALSARLADGSMQVTVQTTPCQNPEHDHEKNTDYYADEPAYGVITVAATNAEPPEEDTAALYVSLNFSNEHGSVTAEPDQDYSYTLTKTGTTYTFDLPRPAPGTQVEIPFTVQYETSLDHGGTATLWCSNQANPAVAPQAKPQATKTLTWAVYEVKQDMLEEGTYGSYIFKHNTEKNGYTNSEFSNYFKDTPLGLAGNFHIVAFNNLYIGSTDCNGNVLANHFYGKGQRVATRHHPYDLSYIIHADDFSSNVGDTNTTKNTSVLVLGSDNNVCINPSDSTHLLANNKQIEHPSTIIQDEDSANKPFIDLQDVRNEIERLQKMWASQPDNGVIKQFQDLNNPKLEIPNPDGAYYCNLSADELGRFSNMLDIDGFKSNHDGSLIITVDCAGKTSVNLPQNGARVLIDGNKQATGETTVFDNGKVIWNFINATGVTIQTGNTIGALIAPGAHIIGNVSVDGTLVADDVTINAESHRLDFTGTTVPANLELQCKKLIDGTEPGMNQTFNFILEKWNGSTWTRVETRQNTEEWINFAPLTFQASENGQTYWYCISEQEESDTGYKYDDTKYYVKACVYPEYRQVQARDDHGNLKKDENGPIMITVTEYKAKCIYYLADSNGTDETALDGTTLKKLDNQSDMVFHNTTDDGAHTLPSTGGPGEWTIPSIGLLLMAGSLLVVTKQRPQRKEDR